MIRSHVYPLIPTAALNDAVKEALCRHFHVSAEAAQMRIGYNRFARLVSSKSHYYFRLCSDSGEFRAFGKVIPNAESPKCHSVYGAFTPTPSTESENLQQLARRINEKRAPIPRFINLIRAEPASLLLLEALDGFQNLSRIIASFILPRHHRSARIVTIAKRVLDRWASLQGSLSAAAALPVNTETSALLDKLHQLRSLPLDTTRRLSALVTERANSPILGRQGIVHGDLGPRNILVGTSDIAFIDWEAMQHNRYSLYDPCFFVTSLILRSLQLFLSDRQIAQMRNELFEHVIVLERQLLPSVDPEAVRNAVWFGRQLAQVHILSRYEPDLESGGFYSFARRRKRQVRHLIDYIKQDVAE